MKNRGDLMQQLWLGSLQEELLRVVTGTLSPRHKKYTNEKTS